MCVAVRCPECAKATWAGCGDHVAEALAPFPQEQRCTCDGDQPRPVTLTG